MSLDITVKKDYILVEPKEGADFREIRRGIARLFYVPEVPDKNDIWVFRKGLGKFSHDDLYKLRDIIKDYNYYFLLFSVHHYICNKVFSTTLMGKSEWK